MVNTKGTMTNRQWRTIQKLLKLRLNIFLLSKENLEGLISSWRNFVKRLIKRRTLFRINLKFRYTEEPEKSQKFYLIGI